MSDARTLAAGDATALRRFESAVFAITLLVLAAASATALMVATGLVSGQALAGVLPVIASLVEPLIQADLAERALISAASLVVGMMALGLLLRRFSGSSAEEHSGGGYHVLSQDDDGTLVASCSGIETIARVAAERVPGILSAEAKVRGSGSGPISVKVSGLTYRDADLKNTGQRVQTAAKAAVEQLAGIEVRRTLVSLDVAPPEDFGHREVW